MLATRVFFVLLILLNAGVNGFALAHYHGGYVAHETMVTVALVFNLLMLPLAVFAAYRMGGMTEEIYREKAEQEVARAGEVARQQSAAAREAAPAAKAAGSGPTAPAKGEGGH